MSAAETNESTEDAGLPVCRAARLAALVCLALGLALPLLSAVCGVPRDVRLAGAERPSPGPSLTWRQWFDGGFARAVEPWLTRRLGLRGVAVRTANQINYSLFGRLPVSAGTPIMAGRGGWLYEMEYVRHYKRRFGMHTEDAENFVAAVSGLQRVLAQRGIAFALLISPSKAEIYSEHLPAEARVAAEAARAVRTNAYERLLPRLHAAGVPVVDMHAGFLAWKGEGTPLFPPGGTHWNHYGAQRTLAEAFAAARAQPAGRRLPELPAIAGVATRAPVGSDTDLLDLLNLWRFRAGAPTSVPFPMLAPLPAARQGRVLLVGDSFTFTLIDALARTGAMTGADFLYYFKRRYRYDWSGAVEPRLLTIPHGDHDLGPISPGEINWNELLTDTRLVVLEINEIFLRHGGWGFPEALSEIAWRQH
ncbi:MAG: hypothetical protein PHR35_02840 [Kiritimatiellae bacterium]|nr:hypothetical protein [Kiritimatiellia bacterium]